MSAFLPVLGKAWIIGFTIAAPLGPIGMLCFRKTIEIGLIGAICVGLGASLADSIYGMIAASSVTTAMTFLINKAMIIKMLGGSFLLRLGIVDLRKKGQPKEAATSRGKRAITLVWQTFFLTLTNPMTILSFIAIFAGIGIGSSENSLQETLWIALGIFLGSMTWWMILGKLATLSTKYLSSHWIERIQVTSALILIGFGGWAVFDGTRQFLAS